MFHTDRINNFQRMTERMRGSKITYMEKNILGMNLRCFYIFMLNFQKMLLVQRFQCHTNDPLRYKRADFNLFHC